MEITIHSSFLPHTDHERDTVLELIAKGSCFGINLATANLDDTFAKLESIGAGVAQGPIGHDYGVRDSASRDRAGNLIRIRQQTPTKEN